MRSRQSDGGGDGGRHRLDESAASNLRGCSSSASRFSTQKPIRSLVHARQPGDRRRCRLERSRRRRRIAIPFAVLGPHRESADGTAGRVVVRTIQPAARLDRVAPALERRTAADDTDGTAIVYEAAVPATGADLPDYRLRVSLIPAITSSSSTIRIATGACSPTSTCTCSARARTIARSKSSARTASRVGVDCRRALRGVGAERGSRQRDRRLQRMGRPRPPDAPSRPERALGALRARASRRRELQVRDPRDDRCAAEKKRSVRVRVRGAAADRVDRPRHLQYQWHDEEWMASATEAGHRLDVSR